MDDGYREYRKNKPQQRIYKPGSGPLRRSAFGLDGKMDNCNLDSMGRGQERSHYGSHNSINEASSKDRFVTNSRYKKPEQQLYMPRSSETLVDIDKHSQPSGRCENSSQYNNRRNNVSNKQDKHSNSAGSYRNGSRKDRSYADYRNKDDTHNDVNYNRHFRPASETRSISPTHSLAASESFVERNRDSRSMETSAGHHMFGSSGKPPSGRRNSAGYPSDQSRPKYMMNLDNIPPRFRKKYLEQSGHHSFESVDNINRDSNATSSPSHSNYNHGSFHNANPGWSQTLPSRGRGRLKETDGFDRDKFINSYLRNYEVQNTRRSTPSNSYMNLYESTAAEARSISEKMNNLTMSAKNTNDHDSEVKNGLSNSNSDLSCSKGNTSKTENESDSETSAHISSTYMDIKNLDWTEEVEKNIKLDDLCDSSASFSCTKSSVSQPQAEVKPVETKEGGGSSKRRGRSKRRDKRSRSRGQVNPETPKNPERTRRDSNASVQQDSMPCMNKQRERRDSHRSNRSSNLGNSRDDLSNWRSLRSYSREQSTERRIVSQCNSRETSINRAISPRDNDGFRIPSKPANWAANQPNPKKNGSWTGRGPSSDRSRQSPAPISESQQAEPPSSGGSKRSSKKRSGRRKGRGHSDIAQPVPVPPGSAPAPTNMNWRDEIIESKKHAHDKPEPHYERTRLSSTRSEKSITDVSTSQPGVIILPQGQTVHNDKNMMRGGSVENQNQKTLYDHHNPSKPIIIQTSPSKIDMRLEQVGPKESSCQSQGSMYEAQLASRAARHRSLLQQVERADAILQTHMLQGANQLANHWNDLQDTRKLLQNALHKLLMSDLKYCQADNIEHHFWKILYYNFIEVLRKSFTQVTPEEKTKIVKLLNILIDEGNTYFENLVQMLENMYKFSTDDYINDNHILPPKGLGYVGLALISVQKLYVFLGDLARYKEQVNETNNYAKSKFWYTKAQQINPKNGRPYNQLAILAIYARRKLDAVYYYMRSLMSSNPFQSARESLLSLFDENSKKFEAAERKRRAALESTKVDNADPPPATSGHGFRREVWIRPSGHKTTTLSHDSRDEHLNKMSSVELNKSFITSYLHVHGKLITRIGMESFHSAAGRMLVQFRSLLQRQPLPMPAARLLQLTALNMFAVEANRPTDTSAPRSPWLDCALGVSLLMWGLVVERCCSLLPEPEHSQQHADARLLLPAVKVWSDWMLCHCSIWNPPPSFDAFDLQTDNDPWVCLAKLMNILETLDDKSLDFENEQKDGHIAIRLSEDTSLGGFTPLMYMEPAVAWVHSESAIAHNYNVAEHALRIRKLLFFGTEYLVGVEPPVLKLEYPTNASPRYVSAVQILQKTSPSSPLQHLSEDSEEESEEIVNGPINGSSEASPIDGADETTRRLLRRKEMLENRKATMEHRRQRMQEIVRGGWVSVEVVVRPRWLVPDTNCFIDRLPLLRAAADHHHHYLIAIPLVVVSELEGLCKCPRVGGRARAALVWVRACGPSVRLASSRGSLLASRAFTAEQEPAGDTNDDTVLATAISLHQNLASEPDTHSQDGDSKCVRRVREVVLLTDDRNLRVKALAAELPARDLPSFISWAGLTPEKEETSVPEKSSAQK